MTRSEEIIWLAGLCEGEACFSAAKDSRGYRTCLRVKLEMTDFDVIQRAANLFYSKASIRRSSRQQENPNRQSTFVYVWNGTDAEKIMRAVLPYMGERRAAKIRECLKTPNLSHRKAIA